MTKEQLGTLILDSERQMYSTAKSMLYSDQDCADAIQETIVKAFSGVHTLRNDKYAKTWLMRILINECYTILRKTSKVISLDEMCETTELAADEKSDYSDLYKAVGSLKEDLRMPVILYYIENFNIREIAQIMEVRNMPNIRASLIAIRAIIRSATTRMWLQRSRICLSGIYT
mgnify:CR=1 FL=1